MMEWKKTLPRWRWAYYFSPWNGWLLLESVRQKRTGELTGMTQPKCLRLGFLVERLWCRKWSVTGTVFVLVNADLYYVWRGSVTHRKKKKCILDPLPSTIFGVGWRQKYLHTSSVSFLEFHSVLCIHYVQDWLMDPEHF